MSVRWAIAAPGTSALQPCRVAELQGEIARARAQTNH
jgi:hypothetical protein